MTANIIDNCIISFSNLTQSEEDLVAAWFSAKLPSARYIDKFKGGWDGIYRRYDKAKAQLPRAFLAELKDRCQKYGVPLVVEDHREPWPFQVANPDDVTQDYLPGIVLEQYQIDAIKSALSDDADAEVGIISATTGSGKTEMMAGLCKAIKCPTVILADQLVIIDQIKQRLELRQVIDEAGLFYGGKTPNGQLIIIGSVASLAIPKKPVPPYRNDYMDSDDCIVNTRITSDMSDQDVLTLLQLKNSKNLLDDELVAVARKRGLFGIDVDVYHELAKGQPVSSERRDEIKEMLFMRAVKLHENRVKGYNTQLKRVKVFRELVRRAEMLLVDECDLATSSTYREVFRNLFSGRRRYGFSGTPFDPARPVEGLFLREHLGSIIYHVDRKQVEECERIIPIEFIMLAFGDATNIKEASTLDIAIKDNIVNNERFHKLTAMLCNHHPEDGILILVDRDDLGKALCACIKDSVFIHGKTPKKTRNQRLREFEARKFRVLIGGKILGRGVDLSGGCEVLIIATTGKISSALKQRIGRAVRINKKGIGRVYGFYFLCNRYLYGQSRAALRTVAVDLGYKSKVIFKNGKAIDGLDLISARFRRPRDATGA